MAPLLPTVMACEEAFGAVEGVEVPPEYVAALLEEMAAADRDDLAPFVVVGDPGTMVVTAAGRPWPFGGL
jgi:hypothetical protein